MLKPAFTLTGNQGELQEGSDSVSGSEDEEHVSSEDEDSEIQDFERLKLHDPLANKKLSEVLLSIAKLLEDQPGEARQTFINFDGVHSKADGLHIHCDFSEIAADKEELATSDTGNQMFFARLALAILRAVPGGVALTKNLYVRQTFADPPFIIALLLKHRCLGLALFLVTRKGKGICYSFCSHNIDICCPPYAFLFAHQTCFLLQDSTWLGYDPTRSGFRKEDEHLSNEEWGAQCFACISTL